MNIILICWSHRNEWSYKVTNFLEYHLQKKEIKTSRINLSEANIPLRSPDRWSWGSDVQKILNPIREKLSQADWFVIVSPERWGMVTPWLKNFFLIWNSDKNEFAHKPALITTVSWGTWWAYPVAELRMTAGKNSKILFIPDHLIVRNVNDSMNSKTIDEWEDKDIRIKKRANWSLDVLIEYTKAMISLRKQENIDLMQHWYWM